MEENLNSDVGAAPERNNPTNYCAVSGTAIQQQ